jgi:thiamine-phosphate pyrophosphorylase
MDANLNRAREGLRVLEDACRFVLDVPSLYARFRTLRHALDRQTRVFYPDLVKARNSQNDMGKNEVAAIQTGMPSVLTANIRRAQEALRVLEEFSRLFPGSASQNYKRFRFTLYTLEKELAAHRRKTWPNKN